MFLLFLDRVILHSLTMVTNTDTDAHDDTTAFGPVFEPIDRVQIVIVLDSIHLLFIAACISQYLLISGLYSSEQTMGICTMASTSKHKRRV